MERKTTIVNLLAGPDAGKSSMMHDVMGKLKWKRVLCEQAPEWVKPQVYEERKGIFLCQPYIFGKQLYTIQRLVGKVDIIVTDSPLILSTIYDDEKYEYFKPYVLEVFNSFDNMNFFLDRRKDGYEKEGRFQTEEQAKAVDGEIKLLLDQYQILYREVEGSPDGAKLVANLIIERLKRDKLEANK
jgi:hypothetical protein